MKKSELKEYIKAHIRETLYAGPQTLPTVQKNPSFSRLTPNDKVNVTKKLQSGGSVELEEMARIAKVYKIAPDFRKRAETIETGGPISPVKLKNVLDFLEGKETTTGPEIAAGVGYPGLMPRIFAIFDALIERGALILTSVEKPVEVPKPYKFMDDDEDEDVEDVNKDDEEKDYEDEYEKKDDEEEDYEEKGPEGVKFTKRDTTIDSIGKAAASFLLDNGRILDSIIRSYKDIRSHIKEVYDEYDISPEDFRKMMKQTKETSVIRFTQKLDEFVEKIKKLEPEVQQKVIDMLSFKLKSVSAEYVAKLISKKVGRSSKTEIPIEVPDELNIEDDEDEELVEDIELKDTESYDDFDQIYERIQKIINYKK